MRPLLDAVQLRYRLGQAAISLLEARQLPWRSPAASPLPWRRLLAPHDGCWHIRLQASCSWRRPRRRGTGAAAMAVGPPPCRWTLAPWRCSGPPGSWQRLFYICCTGKGSMANPQRRPRTHRGHHGEVLHPELRECLLCCLGPLHGSLSLSLYLIQLLEKLPCGIYICRILSPWGACPGCRLSS